MARRRAQAAPKPVEEEVVEQESEQEPEVEQESEQEPEQDDQEEQPQQGEQRALQFNEELSWRPAKPIPTGTLISRLERLSKELADFEQEEVDLESLKDVASKLGHRNLLQHKDRGVKAYTACCAVDLLRLFVPDAPFTDDQLKVSSVLHLKLVLRMLIRPLDDVCPLHQRHCTSSSRPHEPI